MITDDDKIHDSELNSPLVKAFLKAEQGKSTAITIEDMTLFYCNNLLPSNKDLKHCY